MRYARAGRIALLTPVLGVILVLANLIEAGLDEVKHQVEKVQEQHQVMVQRKDTTILVLGTDDVPNKGHRKTPGRSDTMLLVNIQYSRKKIRVLSIPRDTFVMVDYGRGLRGDKIAHAFRRGKIGWLSSKQAVERLTRLKVDNYVTVDYGLFREFIDAIGGVHMSIEKAMNYEDRAGGLFIHFDPGEYVLNGQKALEYVRFRKDGRGDIGRIRRQQKFIQAVAKKLLHLEAWNSLLRSETIQRIFRHLDTDLEVSQIPALAYQFRGASPSDISARVLPGEHALRRTRWTGTHKLSYFFLDYDTVDSFLDEWFLSAPRPPLSKEQKAALIHDKVAAAGVMSMEEEVPAKVVAPDHPAPDTYQAGGP
jgi:LCP family protein required for cell wall assembly